MLQLESATTSCFVTRLFIIMVMIMIMILCCDNFGHDDTDALSYLRPLKISEYGENYVTRQTTVKVKKWKIIKVKVKRKRIRKVKVKK